MQEQIYAEMNARNATAVPQLLDKAAEPTTNCIAAWTGGAWHLTAAYRRLIGRLTTLAGEYMTFYWPEEAIKYENGNRMSCELGVLHQTLLQVVGFKDFDKLRPEVIPTVMDAATSLIREHAFPLSVEYRGLVWTPTGLAIAGYTADYTRLMNLRDILGSVHGAAVPYKNDIVHATIARWISQPPADILIQLRNEVARWQEAVFGHLVVRSWTVGVATLLMQPVDRYDRCTVSVPLYIYHRGNSLDAPSVENDPQSLSTLVAAGRHVEVDVWLRDGVICVGHDGPEHPVSLSWLESLVPRALIHCKDGATFVSLRSRFAERGLEADLFYHTTEDYVLSTGGKIIVYPGKKVFPNCLSMMPESVGNDPLAELCAEICSDKLP